MTENEKELQDWLDSIDNRNLKVAVIGIGRIGLPTALMISNKGFKTYGIDVNTELVEKINQGGGDPPIPFVLDEPDLPEALEKVTQNGLLQATTDFEQYAPKADIIITCIPTPVTEQKIPDYSIINEVIQDLGQLKEKLKGKIIIVESTVGPRYVECEAIPQLEELSGLKLNEDFWVASCPERANPGNIMKNLVTIPRIVGASNEFSKKAVTHFYESVFNVQIIQVSNPRTANSVKLIENIFRAVNIAFSNEISQLMRRLKIDFMEVIKGAKSKYNFLPHYPGPGVGGPCLPSNPYYLINDGYKVSFTPNLVRMATEINQRQPAHVTELIFEGLNEINQPISGTKIALLGLSYKPNVKDVQISPVIPILEDLKHYQADIGAYDPFYAGEKIFGLDVKENYNYIKKGYPMIVLHTDHDVFHSEGFKDFLKECKDLKVIIDCHNIFNYDELPRDIYYIGVGRPLKYIK